MVNCLSSWSERVREERSGDDNTMDGIDGNGNDPDCSSLDMMDKASCRKQRKSTPRKIPRQSSGNKGEGREEEEEEECEDEEEEEEGLVRAEDVPSLHFQPLTDVTHLQPAPSENNRHDLGVEGESLHPGTSGEMSVKRSRRDRSHQRSLTQNGDFVPGLSDSDDKDDGAHDEMDDDWTPSNESRRKHGKGAKLDSLIAEKFKSS